MILGPRASVVKRVLLARVSIAVVAAPGLAALATEPVMPEWSPPAEFLAQQEQEAVERLRREWLHRQYERRRAQAHARMARTPPAAPQSPIEAAVFCPVPVTAESRRVLERLRRERQTLAIARESRTRSTDRIAVRAVPQGGSDDSMPLFSQDGPVHGEERPAYGGWFWRTEDRNVAWIPFLPSAADSLREGVVRLVNHSAKQGEVRIDAIDDAGRRYGPLTLPIGGTEAIHFTSRNLESGDGPLEGYTGPGQGNWRLEIGSDLPVEALAYVRSPDGLLAPMHDAVPVSEDGYRIAVFRPAGRDNAGLLRLINPSAVPVGVVIRGADDNGAKLGEARVSIPAGVSRTLTAKELASSHGWLPASLGPGNWRLMIAAERPIVVMNLAAGTDGRLANLSTSPKRGAGVHRVPLLPSAADAWRRGLVRVVNHSSTSGTVRIEAIDDTDWEYEPLTLHMDAGAATDLDADDIELGNEAKGLANGTGSGHGHWRLVLTSDLDIQVLAYVRALDGALSPMHDTVARAGARQSVPFFGPGDGDRTSLLRLENTGEDDAEVLLTGIDAKGRSPGGEVRIAVPAGTVRTITAQELESGAADVAGALGDGDGAWRLVIESDRPVQAMSLLAGPDGRLVNLSTAPPLTFGASSTDDTGDGNADDGDTTDTAESVFRDLISTAIVQSKCVNCHVSEGDAKDTGLIFVKDTDEEHEAKNLQAFKDFWAGKADSVNVVLDKITNRVDHGGDEQVSPDSDEYADMARFLTLLDNEMMADAVDTLFENVTIESDRKTLRRAALVFAGRNPRAAEYASVEDPGSLRTAIRGLMTCSEDEPRHLCAFHEYLIRSANDRLLTDQLIADPHHHYPNVIDWWNPQFVAFTERLYELSEEAFESGDWAKRDHWFWTVQYGAARAPLELIAHLADGDYRKVLTADYIMANPMAAEAYGADLTTFDNLDDVHEFRESEIATYYRVGEGFEWHWVHEVGRQIISRGDLLTAYPQAGLLNTTAFLRRHSGTPTNQNRTRARWTYYHFLGTDIEKGPDPDKPIMPTIGEDATDSTNNPTMNNDDCTICHAELDPVAGTFQNYAPSHARDRDNHAIVDGNYQYRWGGMHSLPESYTSPQPTSTLVVEAAGVDEQETYTATLELTRGARPFVRFLNNEGEDCDRDAGEDRNIHLDRITMRNTAGGEDWQQDPEALTEDHFGGESIDDACGRHAGGTHFHFWWNCSLEIPFDVPEHGTYEVDVLAYADQCGDETAELGIGSILYETGDTWFRDMPEPSFNGETATNRDDDTLRWLAERIAADDRFAEAAVKFWWPSIMGSEVAERPIVASDANFRARRLAYEAQREDVRHLAAGFRDGFGNGDPYNLKDLLVEIALSDWFRAESLDDEDSVRAVALRNAGARRLLTPEELARKTAAITGFQWGRDEGDLRNPARSHLTSDHDENGYRLLYGGIDSNYITERARDVTATMAAVAQTHAVRSSCPIVLREIYLLPREQQRQLLFEGIDETVSPALEAMQDAVVTAPSSSERQYVAFEGNLTAGTKTVSLRFTNDFLNEETGEDRNVRVDRMEVRRADDDELVAEVDFEKMDDDHRNCAYPDYNGETGQTDHANLWTDECSHTWDFELTADGEYKMVVEAWADRAGDEEAELEVRVYADAESPQGIGAQRIRAKLAELYALLLGEDMPESAQDANESSPDVEAAYGLFVEVWQRKRQLDHDRFLEHWPMQCDFSNDRRYFRGMLEDAWVEYRHGANWNWNLIWRFVGEPLDERGAARAWVVVLAHLMMDYRYLYL